LPEDGDTEVLQVLIEDRGTLQLVVGLLQQMVPEQRFV
jgi:hypothetical protein